MKQISIKILIGSLAVVAITAFVFVAGSVKKQAEIEPSNADSGPWFSAAPAAQAQEIIEMRTNNSKTWFLGNQPDGTGKYMWQGSIGDMHYKNNPNDPQEPWKDINNNIVASDREGYDYQMTEAGYKIYLKEKFNEGKIVRYEKQEEWLEIEPGALSWGDGKNKQSISGPRDVLGSPDKDAPSQIYWPNAYGGKVDFKFIARPTRVVKILGVENFNHLTPIDPKIFPRTNDIYLELNLSFEYSGNVKMEQKKDSINFKNSRGEILWQFMKPNFWDSSEPPQNGFSDFNLIEEESDRIKIFVRVPYNWLKKATFPVYIDPTAAWNVAASADDATVTWNGSAWSINLTTAGQEVGYASSVALKRGGGMRWLNLNIPGGATINSAVFTVVAAVSRTTTVVNSVIIGEKTAVPAEFSTIANYQARRGTIVGGADDTQITSASVTWNSIASWTSGTSYTSPDFSAVAQEIVNLPGWLGDGTDDMVIFWDDHASNGTQSNNVRREGGTWDYTTPEPILTITWMGRPPGMGPSGGGFLMF